MGGPPERTAHPVVEPQRWTWCSTIQPLALVQAFGWRPLAAEQLKAVDGPCRPWRSEIVTHQAVLSVMNVLAPTRTLSLALPRS